MSIAGPPTTIGNVSAWSHSTIFTTSVSTTRSDNVPALTAAWTPPVGCSNRWMAESVVALVATTVASVADNDTITFHVATLSGIPLSKIPANTMPTHQSFVPIITTPESGRDSHFYGTFIAFSTQPSNTSQGALFDASYSSCQPLGPQRLYSPAICPNGQTVAEITEYHYSTTSGSLATRYEASCCQSGMAFRAEWESACISNISTPLPIFEPFTTTVDGQQTSAYEYIARVFVAQTYGTDGYSTSTFSNISTATSGFIGAEPIVVGFQEHDLLSFPTDYVSSLAKRYNRTWTATGTRTNEPSAASTPSLPAKTSVAPESPRKPGLSGGARAGIGVGVGISIIAVLAIGGLLLLRRRQKVHKEAVVQLDSAPVPEMEDGDKNLSRRKWFLFGKWRNELPVENKPQELDSTAVNILNQEPVELNGEEWRLAEHQI